MQQFSHYELWNHKLYLRDFRTLHNATSGKSSAFFHLQESETPTFGKIPSKAKKLNDDKNKLPLVSLPLKKQPSLVCGSPEAANSITGIRRFTSDICRMTTHLSPARPSSVLFSRWHVYTSVNFHPCVSSSCVGGSSLFSPDVRTVCIVVVLLCHRRLLGLSTESCNTSYIVFKLHGWGLVLSLVCSWVWFIFRVCNTFQFPTCMLVQCTVMTVYVSFNIVFIVILSLYHLLHSYIFNTF